MQNQSAPYQNANFRRITAVIILILVITLLVLGFDYLKKGTIEVNTSDKSNLIEVRGGGPNDLKQQTGSLKISLPAGDYTVIVSNRLSSVKQTVSVKPHKTSKLELDISKPAEAVPAAPFGATSLYADGVNIEYVDMRDHLLYRLGADGVPVNVSAGIALSKIAWQDFDHGLAASLDGKSLYSFVSGKLSAVSSPVTVGLGLFDMNRSGKSVISDGRDVYIGSNFSYAKIYNSSSKIEVLALGADRILLVNKAGRSDKDQLKVLSLNGKQTGSAESAFYSAAWSADGSRLAVTSDESTKVYGKDLSLQQTLPDKNVAGLKWLDNDSLVYGVGGSVYEYDASNSRSSQTATLDTGDSVAGIYPERSGSRLFILSENDSANQVYQMLKINLTNKAPASLVGLFLPVTIDSCSATYVALSAPIVEVSSAQSSQQSACIQSAKNYLAKDGMDTSSLGFNFKVSGSSSDY